VSGSLSAGAFGGRGTSSRWRFGPLARPGGVPSGTALPGCLAGSSGEASPARTGPRHRSEHGPALGRVSTRVGRVPVCEPTGVARPHSSIISTLRHTSTGVWVRRFARWAKRPGNDSRWMCLSAGCGNSRDVAALGGTPRWGKELLAARPVIGELGMVFDFRGREQSTWESARLPRPAAHNSSINRSARF
jgi:hypothetical protein